MINTVMQREWKTLMECYFPLIRLTTSHFCTLILGIRYVSAVSWPPLICSLWPNARGEPLLLAVGSTAMFK